MTTPAKAPRIAKWPFLLGDLLLLGLAGWIVYHYPHPLPMWAMLCVVVCVALGAWFAVTPFLIQYKSSLKFAETDALTTAVDEINNVRTLANQISFATAQWQVVQEHAGRTVEEARGISEKLTEEARAFGDFMAKANDREKGHLRLEVDKLRRGQEDWLQVLIGMLDHTYGLYRAGVQAGQENLIHQLGRYQMACRDLARRLGLVPFEAKPEEPFNPETHQAPDGQSPPPEGALITETLATGFTFQGQVIRRALVQAQAPASDETVPEAPPEAIPEDESSLPLGSS